MDKFYCDECGEEVDEDCDYCDDCLWAEDEADEEEEE